MSESNSSIQIDVGISTEVMTAKLRAIAKHAEALANELDEIDSAKCEECGRILNITRLCGDSEEVKELRECPRCDQHE